MPDTTRTPRKWYGPTIWTVYDTTSAAWDTVGVFPGAATELWSSSGVLDSGSVKTTGDTLWGSFSFNGTNSYITLNDIYFETSALKFVEFDINGVNIANGGKGAILTTNTGIGLKLDSLCIDVNGLSIYSEDISISDDASIIMTNGIYGWGEVYAYNGSTIDQWADFIFDADGTVYLKSTSIDVIDTDTDNKLCIFDNGSGVTIRNRLGGVRQIKYTIHY